MRIFLLTALTMVAFAANSVLNRAGVDIGGLDPLWFATIRLWSGAVMLLILCVGLHRKIVIWGEGRAAGVGSLLLYIFAFSWAYVDLDAGLGALILFGMVQVTMFAGSLVNGEHPPWSRWLGAGVAFGGLIWVLWPGVGLQISVFHGVLMAIAGIGWGLYSLAGRRSGDALVATAMNFALAAPVGLALMLFVPLGDDIAFGTWGIVCAVISGAITSGLGYALWYSVLPKLPGTVAAITQLTVPIIAMAGGMILLSEPPSSDFIIATILVIGGVALSLWPGPSRAK